jgi:hypothetical protein
MPTTKFLLHSNQFSERGDSVDLISMALALGKHAGIDSIISFPKSDPRNNEARVAEAIELGLNIFQYDSRTQLEAVVKKEQITHNYVFSGGGPNEPSYTDNGNSHWRLLDTKHITRVVFRNYRPHGDYYLYVSEWLYNWSRRSPRRFLVRKPSDTLVSWLPHIVDPQPGNGKTFRQSLNIPAEGKVIGRIGGFDHFDDPAAQVAILDILQTDPDVWFVAVNTQPFGRHERLLYLPVLERSAVWDFYDACDVLLNGRLMGESFGFSIAEPLSLGKPVVAPNWVRNPLMDKHHLVMPRNRVLNYKYRANLVDILNQLLWNSGVNNPEPHVAFSSEMVIRRLVSILDSKVA